MYGAGSACMVYIHPATSTTRTLHLLHHTYTRTVYMQGFSDVHVKLITPSIYKERCIICTAGRTAHADLEAPEGWVLVLGLRLALWLGLGSGWSGPMCKIEIDRTHTSFGAHLHIGGAAIHLSLDHNEFYDQI